MPKDFTRIISFALLASVLMAAVLMGACAPQTPTHVEPAVEISPTAAAQPSDSAPQATVAEQPDPTTPEPAGFTVVDGLGREVRFETAPQRIVLTGKAWFLLVDALYAFPASDDRLVATGDAFQGTMDFFSLVDTQFDGKALLDRDASAEEIAALQPDVVMMKSYLAESQGKPLEELGIPVVYLDFETPEQYQRDLQTIGLIFQNEARTQEMMSYFQTMTDQVTDKTANLSDAERPSVLLVYYDVRDGQAAVQVPPLSWMQTTMVEMAGGRPVWNDIELGKGWTKVNFEQIAVWDPDKIFVVAYNIPVEEALDALYGDLNWQALTALETGELYAFPGDHFSWDQPDTRWVLGLNWLASKIQPDLFADVDMEEQVYQFYATLYGFDIEAFSDNILPLISGDYP
ncbi:MAG: ABC transporter substrate-binding protein [Anaerolineaceae bacterium]|nr:ABC transporter substrate-binding protein [Anaerolineaceae bacterium]